MTHARSVYTVVMPKLGLTMTQATLVKWHKRDGERVEKGELLFDLESDKATLEIEAPASGILRTLVPVGQAVPVSEPIAELAGTMGRAEVPAPESPEAALGKPAGTAADSARGSSPTLPQEKLRASPRARASARERGIDLTTRTGTGPRGMIVAADLHGAMPAAHPDALPGVQRSRATPVARKMAAESGLKLGEVAGTGLGGQVTRGDVERALSTLSPAMQAPEAEPLSGLRAVIAERLSAAWRERPQVTLTTEAEATHLVAARQQVIAEVGEKVSYDAFLVMLVARALHEQSHVNVRLTKAGVEKVEQINVGVAVDTERGLLVPVVRDVAGRGLLDIHRALLALAGRARAGTILPDELTGGTFTITNLGMFEIDAFTPIVNPPECAILGVGRIVSKPIAVNGQVALREMVVLSLSFDHRLIDGGPAARFLQRLKQLVERPITLAIYR